MTLTNQSTHHKAQLQGYFDGVGFDRWSAIYGDDPSLSYIRRTVQVGHERMLTVAEDWLCGGTVNTLLDAGCGTGLFSIAMAKQGCQVTAVDIAPRMVEAAQTLAKGHGVESRVSFQSGDIASVSGPFDAVACFDVLVHYPRDLFVELCTHLAQQSQKTLLITYAPYKRTLAFLHWIGGHFPQGQRRTEIQMIPDQLVAKTLQDAGMVVHRTASINHGFYHVKLLEAKRK